MSRASKHRILTPKYDPFNAIDTTKMARTGPRRNQWTGPARANTPPAQVDPSEPTIRPAKRRKLDNEHYAQYETPQKSDVQSIVCWEDSKPQEERATRQEIFDHCEVSRTRGFEMIKGMYKKTGDVDTLDLQGTSARRHHNDPTVKENRGRKAMISEEDIKRLEKIIWENGFEGRTLTWNMLAEEAGIPGEKPGEFLSGKTIQRHLGQYGWRHCVACRKSFLSKELKKKRVKWAKDMLAKYPTPKDWYRVRFSDEVHFSFGPQGRLYILRKPGERDCPDCIQEQEQKKKKKGKKRKQDEESDLDYKLHAWAAIGYNFKSELHFYDAGNSNGKMNHITYKEQILEKVVKPWLEHGGGADFVLEEDGDSGHGYGAGSNIVKQWKEDYGLKTYKNSAGSPDLAPIENCWQVPKQYVKKHPHFDLDTLKELAREGWEQLSQETINKWVEEMPRRLQDCINSEGKMTGH
jgi:hypothetical protein